VAVTTVPAPAPPAAETVELPVAPAEVRALAAVQRRIGQGPVVATARGMSLFGEHAAGWLVLGLVGAFADRPRRRDWLTATAGVDYTSTAGSLDFPEGEVLQTFFVPIIQDTEVEPVESVDLSLANPSAGTHLGFAPRATLNIISDDGHIGFLSSTFSVSEAAPSGHATITLSRMERMGVAFRMVTPDGVPALLPALGAVSDEWLGGRGAAGAPGRGV